MLLIFARISRRERAAERPWVPTGIFAAGYVAVWAGFSAVAVALQWALEAAGLLSAMMATTTAWLGAAILIAAGLWQLAPIKQRACASADRRSASLPDTGVADAGARSAWVWCTAPIALDAAGSSWRCCSSAVS